MIHHLDAAVQVRAGCNFLQLPLQRLRRVVELKRRVIELEVVTIRLQSEDEGTLRSCIGVSAITSSFEVGFGSLDDDHVFVRRRPECDLASH